MSINQDKTLNSKSEAADEQMNNAPQPTRVNYQVAERKFEVEFFRGRSYVGRVWLKGGILEDGVPFETTFSWTEQITTEELEIVTEQALDYAATTVERCTSDWTLVENKDHLPNWNRPQAIESAWINELTGEIMEHWKTTDHRHMFYRYPKSHPDAGKAYESTPAIQQKVTTLAEVTI
jgi:hypothetical protein